jgi:DNA-binding protein H-NS
MKVNLKGMSRKELEKLRADVDKALARVGEEEMKAARIAAEKAAKSYGYSLEDLADVQAGRKAPRKAAKSGDGRAKVAPKYRNPDDESMTWTGRGRKPKWVVAFLENGGSLDDIRI